MTVSRDPKRYRSFRRFWWLRPGVLLPALLLVLLAVPMLLWIHTYGSLAADIMFTITYLSLTLWFIYFMKGNLLEPGIKRHAKAVEEKRREVQQHRRQQRKKTYDDEIRSLSEGIVTPVLAVWAMDTSLRSRHPFVSGFRVCRIDPRASELHLRIHLDEEWNFGDESDQSEECIRLFRSFVRFFFHDADVQALRPFWDKGFIVLYGLVDDGSLTGAPVPILSFAGERTSLEAFAERPAEGHPPGEIIYQRGECIEPHRSFELF